MTLDAQDPRDVAARMDQLPVTALHVFALALCALGLMLDTLRSEERRVGKECRL